MSAAAFHARLPAPLVRATAHGVFITLLLSLTSSPAASEPLAIGEAERLALAGEPGIASIDAQAHAMRESAIAAGQLPDPRLRLGLMNYPLESGGFGTEGMTQVLVGLHQPLPTPAARNARAGVATARAQTLAGDAAARGRHVMLAVRQSWLESYQWQQAQAILRRTHTVFADLVTITGAAYAVGRRSQHDVLAAELEQSRLDDRLADMAGSATIARADLSRWVGREQAARPLAERLPPWPEPEPLAILTERLADHPLLLAADAGIDGGTAAVQLAEAAYRPDWGVDLSYGYRDGRLPDGRSRSDFFSLMVTVDLPVFRHRRQDRGLAASQATKRAAIEQRDALMRRLSSELATAMARYTSLSERLAFHQTTMTAQSRARSDAAIAAYQSGAGDFNDVVRSRIAQLDIELDLLTLATQRAIARAQIAYLTGAQP